MIINRFEVDLKREEIVQNFVDEYFYDKLIEKYLFDY